MSSIQHVSVPALQGGRERYNDLFGDHAATLVQYMCGYATHAIAQIIKECMDVHLLT